MPVIRRMFSTASRTCRKRARRTLQDFVQTYFAYLGLQQQDFWRYLDTLVFVEATIYQMDEENEVLARTGQAPRAGQLGGEQVLHETLKSKNLLDNRLSEQLRQGRTYWEMERNICKAMTAENSKPCLFSVEDVLSTSASKSFDYRVLHLVLLRLTGLPYNDDLFKFLQLDERLVDIGDDLVDYEDDVIMNSFNILRGFVHLYGRDAELQLVKVISCLEQEHHNLLQMLPAEWRHHHRARHQQASAVPGSGSWIFPKLILDETGYRQQFSEAS